jgi:hypothetical protein
MHSEAARGCESMSGEAVLYMALELSARSWKVLFASSRGGRRERRVAAGDVAKLVAEVAAAKRKLGLEPQARVVSCYACVPTVRAWRRARPCQGQAPAGWPFRPALTRSARGAGEEKRSGRKNGSAGVEQKNGPFAFTEKEEDWLRDRGA